MSYPNGALFVPPQAQTLPAFLPETDGPEMGLAKYRNVLYQGVTVYALSDGSYAQDFPTAQNTNTNYPPYPLMPDQGSSDPNLIATAYTVVPTSQVGTSGNVTTVKIAGSEANGLTLAEVKFYVDPYITNVYYGGHTYTVDSATADALAAYTAHGTGYASCLTAL